MDATCCLDSSSQVEFKYKNDQYKVKNHGNKSDQTLQVPMHL